MRNLFLSSGVFLMAAGTCLSAISAPVVEIGSDNVVGVTRMAGLTGMAPLGVVYSGYGKSDAPIRVADLVCPATLTADDRVWVYDSTAGKYVAFKYENGAWAGVLDENETRPDPETTVVDMGRGVWLNRGADAADAPVYVHGQVPAAGVSVAIAGATAERSASTLISRPFPATGDWDLNGDAGVDWSAVAQKGDEIRTFKANGELDKTYQWNPSTKKWRYRSSNGWNEICTIARGMASWYVRAAGNVDAATLTFAAPAEIGKAD